MKYSILAMLCLWFLSCNSPEHAGEGLKMDLVCTPVVDEFFKKMEQNNSKGALNDLLLSNENIDSADSSTISMKQRFKTINEVSGAFRGSSLLKKKFIKNDLGIYSYLVKYDKKFYRFLFVFYNNGSKTRIYKFSFDDSVADELEQAIKLYM